MFGWGYRADALKWRNQEKRRIDEYLAVSKKCVVSMTLVSGEVVTYTNKAQNSQYQFYNGVLEQRDAEKQLRLDFMQDVSKAAQFGITIVNKHYMPVNIACLEMGEVTDITNEATA